MKMHRTLHILTVSLMLAATNSCVAASRLTPQQCNDYPFVQVKGNITHAQLMNELSELSSVGYVAAEGGAADYPLPLLRAEKRLHAKYLAECRSNID